MSEPKDPKRSERQKARKANLSRHNKQQVNTVVIVDKEIFAKYKDIIKNDYLTTISKDLASHMKAVVDAYELDNEE